MSGSTGMVAHEMSLKEPPPPTRCTHTEKNQNQGRGTTTTSNLADMHDTRRSIQSALALMLIKVSRISKQTKSRFGQRRVSLIRIMFDQAKGYGAPAMVTCVDGMLTATVMLNDTADC